MAFAARRTEPDSLERDSESPEQAIETRLVASAIRRAQAGDCEALGFLYTRFAENVYGYVRSIVQDHDDAEDVTQQVFAKLIRVIGKYEQREVPFLAWILRVARNLAIDHIRARRLVPVGDVMAIDLGPDRFQSAGRGTDDLQDALSTLPPDQREVLILRHFVGLSPTEIAVRLERSESSIHGLHHRGRRALQAELRTRDAAPSTWQEPVAPRTRITDRAATTQGPIDLPGSTVNQDSPG
jgi:RNA polymerase sigma-70 factor (ECF subfamily)